MTAVFALQGKRQGGKLDMRFKTARELRTLVDALADELQLDRTTLSPAQARSLQRAGELQLLADQSRQRALMGDCVATAELVRIENLAARARRALGLSAARKPQGGGLQAYLASKRAAAS